MRLQAHGALARDERRCPVTLFIVVVGTLFLGAHAADKAAARAKAQEAKS